MSIPNNTNKPAIPEGRETRKQAPKINEGGFFSAWLTGKPTVGEYNCGTRVVERWESLGRAQFSIVSIGLPLLTCPPLFPPLPLPFTHRQRTDRGHDRARGGSQGGHDPFDSHRCVSSYFLS